MPSGDSYVGANRFLSIELGNRYRIQMQTLQTARMTFTIALGGI